MPADGKETYAGISADAVRAKTGKGWAEWFAVLDQAGAAKWPHKEIASFLHEQECGDWWSQMVAVGYEQARGLRVKHQTADGFTAEPVQDALKAAIVEGMGIKPRFAFTPLRTAVSGRRVSPPLFESMEILGKDASLARLRRLRTTLAAGAR